MFVKLLKSEFVPKEAILKHEQQLEPIPTHELVTNHNNRITPIVQHIYMSDLNNALRYSLFQEIPLKKKLNTTQLIAIKNYLTILELHFPFQNEKMRTFVKYLNEWLAKTKANTDVDIEDMMATMKIYEDYYHFPEMKQWKACAGSDAKYRGYPCSLWTLFHTLTVSEYQNTLKSQKWSTLHSVLYAMRDYIKNFFGCTYCAKHFGLMAQELETALIYPNSSVLWLWKAHNKANLRLKGDASEDPKFPKDLFPKISQCSECYETSSQFNEKMVFNYLLKHYSSDNIIKDESEFNVESITEKPEKVILRDSNLSSGKSFDSSIKNKSNYSLLNNMDYSLILFLYFASAALILSLCVYLKLRVRKRQKYTSLKSLSYA
jgi:thiol oxidase